MYTEKIQRFKAFWNRDTTDRPIIGFVPKDIVFNNSNLKPNKPISPVDIQPCWYQKYYEDSFKYYGDIHTEDDIIWIAGPLNFPWMESIWGCPVFYSANRFWSENVITDSLQSWVDEYLPKLDVDNNKWAKTYLDYFKFINALSNRRFGVGQTVLRGLSDVLLALRGSEYGVMDYLDRPEEVIYFFEKYTQFFFKLIEKQNSVTGNIYGGYCADIRDQLWAPGPCIRLQEDAYSVLSPSIYRDFIMSYNRKMCAKYQYNFFHIHSGYLGIVDALLEIEELSAIQISYDGDMGAPFVDVLKSAKKVQNKGKNLMLSGSFSYLELEWMAQNLSGKGFYLTEVVDSNRIPEGLYEFICGLDWRR